MEDYEMITRLGGGSFADVYKAKEKSTGELVAIKILKKKYKKWEECLELRECKSLQKLQSESFTNEKGIEHIIKLKQILFINKTNTLNLVFEYMEKDLLELMKSKEPKKLNEEEIRFITYQTLQGLAFMHKYGFFHRDIKPENLLLKNNNQTLKIGDFGLAREIRSIPPYTEYVSTRYYRAPECILKSTNYNSPIDIWALGCVIAEMYMHPQPIFYGTNEKEVLYRICSVLGSPNHENWLEGLQLANMINFKFPVINNGIEFEKIIYGASNDAIDLIKQMLKWDPNKRATASSLLGHPFFVGHIHEINFYDQENYNKNKCFNLNKKLENDKNENDDFDNNNFNLKEDNDDNNFSKMLNDTEGFNKLIQKLKQEKTKEDKEYENLNPIQEEHNIYENNNEKKNENMNNNLGLSTSFNSLLISQKDFTALKFCENKNNENKISNKFCLNENINKNNDIPEIIETEKKFPKLTLVNVDNNDDLGFENAKYLKSIANKNRRAGSARRFLENTEKNTTSVINNEKQNINKKGGSNIDDNEKFNLLLNNDDIFSINKPIIKNEYYNRNLNKMFEKNSENDDFFKRDFQFAPKFSFTNNNHILKTFVSSRRENNIFNKNGNAKFNMQYRFTDNDFNFK